MALIKSRGWEWVLQKGTEMGMSALVPIITARSVIHIESASVPKKLDRWKRIIREAAKQSGRVWVPEVSPPMALEEFVRSARSAPAFVLDERAEDRLRDIVLEMSGTPAQPKREEREITLLVGPEGGWTNDEAEDIVGHGFTPVSLGNHILRAETAALCSLAVLTQFWT
jgi:16S rRNA (uracil1498-N3)-methyltransferase